MRVESITVGVFASNCHFIQASASQVLVVDPGGDADILIDTLRERGWTPAAYLLTHGHMDHVYALAELHERFPAPIGMHPLDARWAFTAANSWEPYYAVPRAPARIDRAWAEGQTWTDAGLTYTIMETPGHSPGGVCFHFPTQRVLISGDTLFCGSIGRTDLPGGDGQRLSKSLKRLAALDPATVVYCGHGPATTIGDELRNNPFLQEG